MTARAPQTRILAVVIAAGGLFACDDHQTGASSAESHAPGTTTATRPGPCEAYPPGAPGVVRVFCDGPATATIRLAGEERMFKGGSCATADGMFSFNLGVVSSPDLGGPKPDYIGLTAPAGAGPFTNATIALTIDGTSYVLTSNSGALTAAGGSFSGTPMGGGEAISGSFACS